MKRVLSRKSRGTSIALSVLSPSFLHTSRPGLRRRDRVFSSLDHEGMLGHARCIERYVECRTSADHALTTLASRRILCAGFSTCFLRLRPPPGTDGVGV